MPRKRRRMQGKQRVRRNYQRHGYCTQQQVVSEVLITANKQAKCTTLHTLEALIIYMSIRCFSECTDTREIDVRSSWLQLLISACPTPPPTSKPSASPTLPPTSEPTEPPTNKKQQGQQGQIDFSCHPNCYTGPPTVNPTAVPTTESPTGSPTIGATEAPTPSPTRPPTEGPTNSPTIPEFTPCADSQPNNIYTPSQGDKKYKIWSVHYTCAATLAKRVAHYISCCTTIFIQGERIYTTHPRRQEG